MARAILLALILSGCGAAADPSGRPAPIPEPPADAAPPPVDAAAQPDAAPAVSEVQARVAMARRFRAAGLRIREDVPVAGITLDGCDPQRRVGYEYVAPEERGLDVTDESRAALAALDGWRVLIVDATDAADLSARVDAFLSALPDPAAASSVSGR